MKKIFAIMLMFATLLGCKTYQMDTNFTAPTSLDAPDDVVLDVSSSERVVFFWSGAQASDGGIILYEVLFDKEGGDFSQPIATFQSDRGSQARLTLTHSQLSEVAKSAGIEINKTGVVIWTVTASRGGVVKSCGLSKEITLTRGDGIDVIPETLAIAGTSAAEPGQEFRKVENGIFSIVTSLVSGSMYFTSGNDRYYESATGKLVIGEGAYELTDAPASGLARITVNFKTLSVKIEELETKVYAQWAATNATFITLEYQGAGVFSGSGDVSFYGPGRPGTPSWCSWVEERYSFVTHVDGNLVRWGSVVDDPNGAMLPDGTEQFYYIYEVEKTDWGNLWKMDHAFDLKAVKITIYTNKDGAFTHSLEETEITPEPGDELPQTLALSGAGAEVDGQAFAKIGNGVFRIYAKISAAPVSFTSGTDNYYYSDTDGIVKGAGTCTLEATPTDADVTRITVDIKNGTLTSEVVNKVRVLYAADFNDIVTLTYQGQGVWSGTGGVWYRDMGGWYDERYYFIPTTNGQQTLCWGRKDGVDPENRPDGQQSADYWDCAEFGWSQWEHCWKLPTAANNGASTTITLYSNKNGIMTHTVNVQ